MSKRIEYHVRPVTRFVVTRHIREDCSTFGTVETVAVCDNPGTAWDTAEALARSAPGGPPQHAGADRTTLAVHGIEADRRIAVLGERIAAVAWRLAARRDLSVSAPERQDGGWRLKFVDDLGSGCGIELTFTDRQVEAEASGPGPDRCGLVALMTERVDAWLAACSPRGRVLQ